jgi:hypothetical protein
MTSGDQNTNCPYCHEILSPVPKRKALCSFCKNEIYVRSKQSYFPLSLLTKTDAMVVDFLDSYHISPEYFLTIKNELFEKYHQVPSIKDIVHKIVNNLTLEYTESNNLFAIHSLSYGYAIFQNNIGHDYFDSLWIAQRTKLQNYKVTNSSLKYVQIFCIGKNSCQSCNSQNSKILSIDEALKSMPLPNKNCTKSLNNGKPGFCECMYIPAPKELD